MCVVNATIDKLIEHLLCNICWCACWWFEQLLASLLGVWVRWVGHVQAILKTKPVL
jgi:hypothetical protein